MSLHDAPTFGDLVRQSRLAAGLTQEELAERGGLSVRGISDLERGLVRAPRRDTLELLADALALSDEEQQSWEDLRRHLAARHQGVRTLPGSQMPTPLTSFVGRERDVAAVSARMDRPDVRLLTLTGPGGVGKTRVAIAVAQRLEGRYPDGIYFIDLVPFREPEHVPLAIAAALGVRISGTRPPLEVLAGQLRQATCLFVIDNMEHVLAAAPDVARLLLMCPLLNVLATSRSPLHVQGEWEYLLLPLDLPAIGQQVDPVKLVQNEAVALFSQRAQAVKSSFAVTVGNAAEVAEICHRLDGLPLAIELAAARIRMLSPDAIIKRLELRLPLLESADRDVPDRHRTLRATIQWSYELLSASERQLFRMLSVFQGSWTLEAAEAVAVDHERDTQDALERLVEQNFVRPYDVSADIVRYRMLETIREFGLEQLESLGEAESVQIRHADYFFGLVEQAAPHLQGVGQAIWMESLERDHANIRAALRSAMGRAAAGDETALQQSVQFVSMLFWFWHVHGHMVEARRPVATVLDILQASQTRGGSELENSEWSNMYARLLFLNSVLAIWTGDTTNKEVVWARYYECLDIYRQLDQKEDIASTLVFLGYGLHMGFRSQDLSDLAEAEACLGESAALYRDLGDLGGFALCLQGLGTIDMRRGKYDRGSESLTESLVLFERIDDTRGIAAARATLGALQFRQGNVAEAKHLLAMSLAARQEIGDKGGIAWCLERLADLALAETASPDSPPMKAARLLGAAYGLREVIGYPIDPADKPEHVQRIATVQEQLSEQGFIAAWEAGRTMALDDVVDYALQVQTSKVESSTNTASLSRRELDVIKLLVEGQSNLEIADTLFISPYTAANHISSIMNKIGVQSRTAAATWAVRNGIG